MCEQTRRLFDFFGGAGAAGGLTPMGSVPSMAVPAAPKQEVEAKGSRRRRIWEMEAAAHCPVVGVCLPIQMLHQLGRRHLGHLDCEDEYELHCAVVGMSRQRGDVAEAIQRDPDQRHQLSIKQAARCKDTASLVAWWRAGCSGAGLGGVLWAMLTHPRCTPEVASKVLGYVHMVQHQVGAATRVDQARFDALQDAHATLQQTHEALQTHHRDQTDRQVAQIQSLEQTVLRLRAELITRDTALAQLRDERDRLAAVHPDLPERLALVKERQAQTERLQAMQKQVHRLSEQVQRLSERPEACDVPEPAGAVVDAPPVREVPVQWLSREALHRRSVLCVGGRAASVPAYRELVEQTGGRFLHHDGGEEDNVQRLEATLAAADLVICQTGCISHGAYWRVKAHCKRLGKPCLFVDTPSKSALARALQEVGAAAPVER